MCSVSAWPVDKSESGELHVLGLASLFAIGHRMYRAVTACRTTDTTNVDMYNHWDYSAAGSSSNNDGDNGPQHEQLTRRISFAETTHSKYLSINLILAVPIAQWIEDYVGV